MTPRALWVRYEHLPETSATKRAINPDNWWTTTEHLLAYAVDVLQMGNWQRGADAKAKRPKPIPRPRDARDAEQRLAARHQAWKASQPKGD